MNSNIAALYTWVAIKLETHEKDGYRAELVKAQGPRLDDHLPFAFFVFRPGESQAFLAVACEEVSRSPGKMTLCYRFHNEEFSSGGEYFEYTHEPVPFSQPWDRIKLDFIARTGPKINAACNVPLITGIPETSGGKVRKWWQFWK